MDFLGRRPDVRDDAVTFSCRTLDLRLLIAADGDRSVCVVDRALPDDRSHAEVWGAVPRSDSKLAQIREQIAKALRPGAVVASQPPSPLELQ